MSDVQKFLSALFGAEEHIVVNHNQFDSELTSASGAALLIEANKSQFVTVNPVSVTNRNESKARSPRADVNVSDLRSFVFESDSIPIARQLPVMNFLNSYFPIRTVVFSGSKSLHFIISFSESIGCEPHTESGIARYKSIWTGLSNALSTSVLRTFPELATALDSAPIFDPSCKNPSRLTRIGGAIRDNGVAQTLLYVGPLADCTLLNTINIVDRKGSSGKRAAPAQYDYMAFNNLLKSEQHWGLRWSLVTGLRLKAASSGMYHELFRLTCWAIDETGVQKEILLTYLWENVLPALIAAGYPMENVEKGIHNAYAYLD